MLFLKLPFAVRPGLTGSRVSKDAKQFRLNLWVPGWLDGLNSQVSWGLGWPPLEMYIWSVYTNIFTKQSGPFNSEENSIRGSFAVSEFGERIGKILIVLLGCKIFEVRMPQTTQRFHSVSDSFHSRIDVWVFMMWPLWPSGSGHSGLCPPLPPPSGHKGHIIQPQTSILSWKLSLTSWKCWVVWVILLSNLLQPTRTIRMLPILSRNSSFRQKDPRKISFKEIVVIKKFFKRRRYWKSLLFVTIRKWHVCLRQAFFHRFCCFKLNRASETLRSSKIQNSFWWI